VRLLVVDVLLQAIKSRLTDSIFAYPKSQFCYNLDGLAMELLVYFMKLWYKN
jgi:hypothetical protein